MICQSRRRRNKERNPGIGIKFKFNRASEYLGTIPKFRAADETGGVHTDRMDHLSQTIVTGCSSMKIHMNGDAHDS